MITTAKELDLKTWLRKNLNFGAIGGTYAKPVLVPPQVGLLSVDDDLRRVSAVREALGDRTSLMVDANHAYSAATAARMAGGLERLDVRWFEEPVVPEDLAGYRRVRAVSTVPVAGGECSFTRFGFRDMLVGVLLCCCISPLPGSGSGTCWSATGPSTSSSRT